MRKQFIHIRYTLVTILLLGIAFSSCEKSETNIKTPFEGSITLNVHCIHHSWDVPYMSVFLKRNATVYPGPDTSLYDIRLQGDGYGNVAFGNLIPGDYYILAKGYDPIWGDSAIGYKWVNLIKENLTNNQMSVTLYVSE